MLTFEHDTPYCNDGAGVKIGDAANDDGVDMEAFVEVTGGKRLSEGEIATDLVPESAAKVWGGSIDVDRALGGRNGRYTQ